MFKKLFYKLTGGRPMEFQAKHFTDVVSGKSVNVYKDKFYRLWMADSGPWSSFRVRVHPKNIDDDFIPKIVWSSFQPMRPIPRKRNHLRLVK